MPREFLKEYNTDTLDPWILEEGELKEYAEMVTDFRKRIEKQSILVSKDDDKDSEELKQQRI